MSWQVLIMFAIAGVFGLLGIALLAALKRPGSEARTYAFRMIGIMALSLGFVLAMSATAMSQWSAEP